MMQVDFRSRTRTKYPTPTPTPGVVRNPTPPKNLLLLTTPAPTPQLWSHQPELSGRAPWGGRWIGHWKTTSSTV